MRLFKRDPVTGVSIFHPLIPLHSNMQTPQDQCRGTSSGDQLMTIHPTAPENNRESSLGSALSPSWAIGVDLLCDIPLNQCLASTRLNPTRHKPFLLRVFEQNELLEGPVLYLKPFQGTALWDNLNNFIQHLNVTIMSSRLSLFSGLNIHGS